MIGKLGGFLGGAPAKASWSDLATNFTSITARPDDGSTKVYRYSYSNRADLYRRIASDSDAFYESEDGSGTAVATRGAL